jgi:hypothetical protein
MCILRIESTLAYIVKPTIDKKELICDFPSVLPTKAELILIEKVKSLYRNV